MSAIPFALRLSATINETVAGTGISRSKLYELINQKKIETRKVDGRTVVLVPTVIAMLNAQAVVAASTAESAPAAA